MHRGPWRPDRTASGLTLRSLLLGLLLVCCITLGAPFSIWLVGSSEITWSLFPIGVGVPFVLLVFGNAAVRRLAPRWAMSPSELVVVLAMGLVCSGIPIFVVGYVLAVISKPYYGATAENEWSELVQPYLPHWAVPSKAPEAMRLFYEGMPQGGVIPWEAWRGPLIWWATLLLAIYLVCFCMVVLLRRQWVAAERLAFPVAEVPRSLVEQGPDSSLPAVMRAPVFWVGCLVPMLVVLYNAIGYFLPGFPALPVHQGTSAQLVAGGYPVLLVLYFPVVGFMYLVSTGISASIWLFYLLTLLESGLVAWAGLGAPRPDEFVWDWQILSWQAYGAFLAMVLWSLWAARGHLRVVLRHVVGRETTDDAQEMLPYRWAAWLGLVALVYIFAWLWRSGMALHVAALYLSALLLMFLGFTRLAIQSGLHYLTPPMTAQALTLAVVGTSIPPANLVAVSLSYACFGDVESLFMPSAAHAARIDELAHCRRGLGVAIALAVVVGFALSAWFILHLCYEYGANNLRSWFFQAGAGAGGKAFDAVVQQWRNPWPTDWLKLAYLGLGAGVYSVLTLCHYRFHWWPVHPVGLTIATTWMVRQTALSVFLAWAVKSAVLRLGGIELYRRLRPFFIGLVVGFFLGVGISYLIDVVWFYGMGHPILHG